MSGVIDIESRRDLIAPLTATQRKLDDAEMLEAMEIGLQLQKADLLTKIGESRGEARDLAQGKLIAKQRQIDECRAMRVAGVVMPRSGT